MIVLAADIGGTKIAGGVVDLDGQPRVAARRVVATPRSGPGDVIAKVLATLAMMRDDWSRVVRGVDRSGGDLRLSGIGIGAPGVIDPTTGSVVAASAVMTAWTGTAIAEPIRRRLQLPTFVDNDVRAMARAEARFGAGRDTARCLYVSLGTGVGGAVSVRDDDGEVRVLRGPHGTVGEIAHLVAPVRGAVTCGCGSDQHLEAIASGPAIAGAYARGSGEDVDLHEVGARLARGDALAHDVVMHAGQVAGEVLAGVASAFDLDGVVVGGGALGVGALFFESLAAALSANVWPRGRQVMVSMAGIGGNAPLIGAALIAYDALSQSQLLAET